MEHARINGSGHQVVGGRDGVDVTSEVQVELFHRHHLRISAACRPAFDAEGRPLRGLTDAGDDALAQICAQRLAEPYGGGCLALPQRCWGDGGDINILAVWHPFQSVQYLQLYLGFGVTVKLKLAG
ncbi:hypothetical protein SDC9_158698 [bioreactor metagenome]|uniref:Uncharacterized protein n=1 Tax=bioreactor metagenome TaxID=1076179 RepID=A0A645FAW4_9ZZZZ